MEKATELLIIRRTFVALALKYSQDGWCKYETEDFLLN